MKRMIQRVPLPLSGVMLGFAALGNLLQSYGEALRWGCGVVCVLLLALILLKLILYPSMIREDLQNPILASVAGTFSMTLMLLSGYVQPWIGHAARYMWYGSILLHVALMVYFTVKFIVRLQMQKVFASYYIVYVGIVVASVTAPVFDAEKFGTAVFWFGFAALVVLLVLVTIRYIRYRNVLEPAKPLICIYAAPTSLCVAGYVQSVTSKSMIFLLCMLFVATLLYLFALVQVVRYRKLPFYPSYAAYTFPFVISAIATKQTMACLSAMNQPMAALSVLVLIQTIVAVILMVYVLVRFMNHIFEIRVFSIIY